MTYVNRVLLKKKLHPRKNKRVYARKLTKKRTKSAKPVKSNFRKTSVSKIVQLFTGIGLILFVLAVIFTMSYLQYVSQDLPTPEKPFGIKNTTSIIYDRSGAELYRIFDEEDRDPVRIENIPALVKWTFLASEDINFYEHFGIDPVAILRCVSRYFSNDADKCGGSTITQQLIKKTALTDEVNLERKVKEVLLAIKIEELRSKDEILEMYLTVVPEGSNIYGITRAAKFYFGKELKDLNLAEISVLAAIPQNPSRLSPTKSIDNDDAKQLLRQRQLYVLGQLERHMEKINRAISAEGAEENQLLTLEKINEAKNFELVYKDPVFEIKAPHFVFYVQEQLQERGYNNGVPFTLEEIETAGLRIFTTLDLSMQKVAEEQVKKAVDIYGKRYGAENAALVAMSPKTGEVFAYVGSYDYFGKPSPEGCTLGLTCRFEPQVSIPETLQPYGSSLKPMVYYDAAMHGLLTPNTILSDVPIHIGSYKPKNYEGKFYGQKTARWMLINSRNIPAIMFVQMIGVENFLNDIRAWGYTTLNNPAGYGPAVAVGGADIKLTEHAQAYGVLANSGKLVKHEVVLRIEDQNGRVLYEHKPEATQVADARGVYLVNQILNGKNGGGLADSWDGRDIAGKTGTSENQKETLYIGYTPEIVAAGWLGNNNNADMRYGATGGTSAKPWVNEFMKRVGDKFPPTPFERPPGVYTDRYGDTRISGINAPAVLIYPAEYLLNPTQEPVMAKNTR